MTTACFPVTSTQLVILDTLAEGQPAAVRYGWRRGAAGLEARIPQPAVVLFLRELRMQAATLVQRHNWANAVHALRRKLERAL